MGHELSGAFGWQVAQGIKAPGPHHVDVVGEDIQHANSRRLADDPDRAQPDRVVGAVMQAGNRQILDLINMRRYPNRDAGGPAGKTFRCPLAAHPATSAPRDAMAAAQVTINCRMLGA